MPLYLYVCQKCGGKMDIRHSVDDDGDKTCPNCGGELKKKISLPAIHFKGDGFYSTSGDKQK